MEMFNYWTQEMGFNLGCIGRSKPSSQLTTDDVACLTNGNASPGKAPPKRQLSVEWGTAGATKAAEGPRTKPQTAKQLEKERMLAMIQACFDGTRPGGCLVYSTCSMTRAQFDSRAA